MKKLELFSLILLLGLGGMAFSQQSHSPSVSKNPTTKTTISNNSVSRKEFIQKAYKAADSVLPPGLPRDIPVAQAILETGGGRALTGDNNIYGIKDFRKGKGTQVMTTECNANGCYQTRQPFKKYPSIEIATIDWYRVSSRIMRRQGSSIDLLRTDPNRGIRVLSRLYATDPRYPQKLEQIRVQVRRMK